MSAKRRILTLCSGLMACLLLTPAQGFNLNKSIKVEDGSETSGHSTINGSITVGRDATVTGALETVNGTIRVGKNSRIEDAETVNGGVRIDSGVTARDVSSVNGSIRLAENVSVDGEVSVVNGRIEVEHGSKVSRGVSNVNGEISIAGADIGGDLSTVNGDVRLSEKAIVRGDLIVEKPGGWNDNQRKPQIIIGPESRVGGEIKLEREVELFISDTAQVGGVSGVMGMEDAVRFKGERP